MAELTLRVSNELHERVTAACNRHGLSLSEFCAKAAKQAASGKLKPVVEHKLLQSTTYGGKRVQVWHWPYDLRGRELTAVLVAALLKLEAAKPPPALKIDAIEGIDYNVSENETYRRFFAGEF